MGTIGIVKSNCQSIIDALAIVELVRFMQVRSKSKDTIWLIKKAAWGSKNLLDVSIRTTSPKIMRGSKSTISLVEKNAVFFASSRDIRFSCSLSKNMYTEIKISRTQFYILLQRCHMLNIPILVTPTKSIQVRFEFASRLLSDEETYASVSDIVLSDYIKNSNMYLLQEGRV